MLSMEAHSQASKELAVEVSHTTGIKPLGWIPRSGTVENASNALVDDNSYARVLASPGLLLGGGSFQGAIELKFATERPANTWSYVRIGADQDLLGALLGGSLGELLADVLGTVLLGRQGIEIQARNAVDGIVLSRTSTQGFDTDEVRLVQDGLGNYFLAIKPDQPYDRIRLINNSISILGLGTQYSLDVYHAFYLEGVDTCGDFRFTSFDGEGISLDLLDLGGAGVTNAGNAVDADPNSFSSISIGTLGVGASMFQEIHFEIPSAPEDYFKVKLDIQNPGVLTADLIGGIEVRAYDGDQLIYIDKLSSGLINGLDVLALLQGGNPVSLAFGPGRSFDKITVGYNSLVSLSALSNSPIRLYDVQRFGVLCSDPDPIPLPTATDPMLSMATCDATVLDFGNANFPFNAVDGNNDTFTTLEASSGTALGIGDYEGFIELGFPTRSAGTTSYIRIDFEEEVLLGLLDGSVGQLLGGVVDNVLFGSHYFTLDVKNNGGSILTSSSNNGFFNAPVRIVQDKNNHYYVAVTPDADYNSIRITESLGAILGLGETRSMNVYHVCTAAGFEACEQAFLTYSESNGISLDLLGLGEAGVTDAGFAIDGDVATASEISIGAAGLGASVYQFVEFHSPSAAEDHFRIKLAMSGGSAVTAEVLGSVVVKAFDGDTEVFSQDLRDGLISDLDLLGLLQSGAVVNLPFGPGLSFDRVAIGIESLVGANVIANPLLVYSIERFSDACPDPELVDPAETDPPFNVSDCAGEVVDWSHTNFPLNAIDGHNDTYATLSASAGTALGLGAYSSHIELKFAAPVPAGETSYVRIGLEEDNLNALLGGSLGDDLANLLGAVALGDQYFTVTPKNAGGTDIYTASSATGFGSQNVKVVQDAEGRFYIAFTADEAYQSVRIDFFLTALVGVNNTATMKVYSLCRETEFDLCEQATFTSYDGAGIALDLIDITQGGVFNPQFAIDGNSSNYSTINLGVVGAAASIFQEIYFKTKSQATDALRLRIQLDQPGILNLDLAGAYRLILYNGEDEVYNESLQNALVNNLDLLGLLNSGGIQELLIEPGVVYDRVAFGIQSLVAVNTSAPVRLYGISRISDACPDPDVEEPPYLEPVCAEELISAENADNLANLFDGNFNSYATIRSEGGTLGLGAYSGHVTLGFGDGVIVPAGTTSYMRIDMEDDLLNTLLGGSLGTALSDILGNVVLGDHYFDVIVNDGAGNPLFTASSADAFAGYNDQIKVVKDALGRSYLAITPSAAYNSVRIEDHTSALLLGQENSINIYGLCYETGTEDCATGFTTSFEGTGISVDAGAIGGYGVTNPERALDNNNNDDYSELSLGTLSVAGSIQQSIHFRQSVPANGTFKIKLGVGSGVLDASIFDRVSIVGYLDGNEVYDEALQDAVLGSVNLVNLFNNGADAELRLSLGVEVDEVALKIESVVSATLVPNVRLFYIVQDCETPDFQTWKSYIIDGDASLSSVAGGETVQYTIHIRNTGTISILDYQIQDEIPANTTYVPGSGGTLNGNTLVFEDLDIAPGQTLTQSFSVIVDENLTGITEITNLALVKANPADPGVETYPPLDNENPNDPDETGDTGTDIPVEQIFEVESWKAYTVDGDASLSAVSGGETLVYTIFVRNTGNQDLTDVVITDAIPAGTSYVSGGTMAGNSVTFTIPTLAVGETSVGYSFTVTVDQDLTGLDEIRNVAVSTVTGGLTFESYPPVDNQNPLEPDSTQPPGTVVDVTPIHSVDFSKIGISNNATSTGQAELGDEITYTLSITNTGNKELTGITIEDVIPAGLTVLDAGGASVNGSTLEFSLASLSVGQTLTVEFIVSVDNVTVGSPIVNEAEAFYPDETNNPTSVLAQHSMPTDCVAVDADDISLNSSVSEVCVGGEVTLTAALNGISIPDPVFKWYTNPALSGTPFEGDTYVVNPTATTTYYVIVEADGYCFNEPPAAIEIVVNPLPPTPTASADVTISEGFGTTLFATIDPADPSVEIVWFNDLDQQVGVGSSYDTGVLPVGTHFFYAAARNTVTGCVSAGRDEVIVTVVIDDAGDCTIANGQTVGTDGLLCLLCFATDTQQAVDGNSATASRLTVPVGLLGSIYQTLSFPTQGAAGDSVRIDLGIPGGLADVNLLSRIGITVLNGNTVVDEFSLNESLVHLTLLGGSGMQRASFPVSGSFDRVRISLTGVANVLTSLDIYQAQLVFAAPTAVTTDAEVCQGETALLEATPAAGTSLRWYDAAVGGTLLSEGNSYTTAALNSPGTVTYYLAVLRNGCESPDRIPVEVTVNPAATAADITATGGTICEGESFTLSASAASITNPVFRFYTDQTLATEITDLTVSPTATTTYYVTVEGDGVCENAPGTAAELTVTVNP
ncbi:DUF7507 domain-containing protein, partial [Algoriphagus vanfongensis]|uniref:Ig-like domain-containing protein n=1 Tax=Algoriphagus vanfongensis TaxID=426371 RepID=UPI00047B8995